MRIQPANLLVSGDCLRAIYALKARGLIEQTRQITARIGSLILRDHSTVRLDRSDHPATNREPKTSMVRDCECRGGHNHDERRPPLSHIQEPKRPEDEREGNQDTDLNDLRKSPKRFDCLGL